MLSCGTPMPLLPSLPCLEIMQPSFATLWSNHPTIKGDDALLDKNVYKVFLDHFPKDKDAYEMNFYYGELLWTLSNWKDAAEQYTHVVEMKPEGKYVKEAAYAARTASSKSEQALALAQTNQKSIEATNEKIDRMFRRHLSK